MLLVGTWRTKINQVNKVDDFHSTNFIIIINSQSPDSHWQKPALKTSTFESVYSGKLTWSDHVRPWQLS